MYVFELIFFLDFFKVFFVPNELVSCYNVDINLTNGEWIYIFSFFPPFV